MHGGNRRFRFPLLFMVVMARRTTLLVTGKDGNLRLGFRQSHLVERNRYNRALSKTLISKEELDHCIANLELVAIDGHIGDEEFLLFIENFSERPLYFTEFHELPIQLVLIFYTAACTGGRNCTTEKPRISLEGVGASKGLLHVFCASVKEVAVVQIIFNFQYQVRFVVSENPSVSHNGQGIGAEMTRRLEQLTHLVLLNDLGCIQNENHEPSRALREEATFPRDKPTVYDQMNILRQWLSGTKPDDTESMPEGYSSRRLSENAECQYSVTALIHSSREMDCLPDLKFGTSEGERKENTRCFLVFSEVRVTAASLFQELSSLELRSLVSSALQTAIFGQEFDQYLSAETFPTT